MSPFNFAAWTRSSARTRVKASFAASLAALILATFSACSGGSGGEPLVTGNTACDTTTCGTLLVGLTDANGEFLSYSVDIVSLSLESANGCTVEALHVRQRVDFAELVDLTELATVTDANGVGLCVSAA